MPGDKTRDLRKVNRRSFLRKLSAMGVSGAALQYMTKDALAEVTDDPSDEVPILTYKRHKNHDEFVESLGTDSSVELKREPVYKTVHRDRWLKVQSAFDAASRIRDQFSSTPLVNVGVTEETIGQKSRLVVEVDYITLESYSDEKLSPNMSYNEIAESLPSEVQGSIGEGEHRSVVEDIPVRLKRTTMRDETEYDKEYRPVPAGPRVESPYPDTDGYQGYTLGTPAYDPNASDYAVWVTVAHAFYKKNDDRNDVLVYQNNVEGSDYIGTMSEEDAIYGFNNPNQVNIDAAVVRRNSADKNRKYDIASNGLFEDYEGWFIKGTVGWDRLKNNVDNPDFTLYKQGSTTGRVNGGLDKVGDEYFFTSFQSKDGDSGGPYFEVSGGDSYIAGVHKGFWEDEENDSGTTASGMVHIEDHFDIIV